MEQIPTHAEITTLGIALYEDGVTTHANEVADLVQLLTAVAPDDLLVARLGDHHAPSIVRTRALAKIANRWPDYAAALTSHARQEFDVAFTELLVAWRSHQALRASANSVDELYASRLVLDRLRERIAHLRGRAHPRTTSGDPGSSVPVLCANHA